MFEGVNDNQVLEYLHVLVLPTKFSTVRLLISFKKPIDLRRVFLRYVNISMCKFDGSVSCPGLYGGLYGQNLPYKFKNRTVIYGIATPKNHIELLVPGQISVRSQSQIISQ